MEIEYVTHASLLLRSGGRSLLTDPFFQFDPWDASVLFHFPPREVDPAALGPLSYVYSSHVHPDHSHPGTLQRLKAQIGTVLLPDQHPALLERYRSLGFERIRLLPNGEVVQLEPGLEVAAFWTGKVDTVLVARMGDTVVLHENDCWLELETVREIGRRFRVDYAFMLYTQAQDLYPLLLDRPDEELRALALAREQRSLAYQMACIDALKPRVVVPYSMTMTYFQRDQLRLNGYGRMTPTTFRDAVAQERPGVECLVLQPGDVIDPATGAVRRLREENLWGRDLDEYLRNVEAHVRAHLGHLPPFDPGELAPHRGELQRALAERLQSPHPWPEAIAGRTLALTVYDRSGTATTLLDLKARRAIPAAPGWQKWLPPAKRPALEITLPASTLQYFLQRIYDPFSLLFSYRVTFKADPALQLSARDEVNLSIDAVMALFAPDAEQDVGAV